MNYASFRPLFYRPMKSRMGKVLCDQVSTPLTHSAVITVYIDEKKDKTLANRKLLTSTICELITALKKIKVSNYT